MQIMNTFDTFQLSNTLLYENLISDFYKHTNSMAHYYSIFAKYFLLSLITLTLSLLSDYIIEHLKRSSSSSSSLMSFVPNSYLIALCDNLSHALIASLSWLMICASKGASLNDELIVIQSLLCATIASVIDLDHVIEARSFDLKVISQLNHRPFLHCTTLVLFIAILVIVLGVYLQQWLCNTIGWIILTATFTHHLRDALRHGFWLSPFVHHTKPVPLSLYMIIIITFPLICSWTMDICGQIILNRYSEKNNFIKYKTVNSNIV